jgi:hypothetical protein
MWGWNDFCISVSCVLVCLFSFANSSPPFDWHRYESGESVLAQVYLQDGTQERLFEKGEHVFAFALVIPSSTAPYERCQYGRVYHKLVAIAEGEGFLGSKIVSEAPISFVVNAAPYVFHFFFFASHIYLPLPLHACTAQTALPLLILILIRVSVIYWEWEC